MKSFKGQYLGAALRSFVRALHQSEAVLRQILRNHGLERIDEEQWYDLNTARSIYYTVGAQVGERSLHGVGLQMIDAAQFPPGIDDIRAVLQSLDAAYRMNCRGPEIGAIICELEGDHTASVTFATPFPCALTRGILQGCARKFAPDALIEHSREGCVDRNGPSCCFHVEW
ncbi:hypothetical protein [Nannocystis punicea]|uniref:4-vinyl reductase 4VR domain-containing protein n=1 Tax=Nannocystis punicea TaxID=2995304 RepID=A0ABY7H5J5_9BACT|nr:hypothetical protein [Nannocystis poenicansa]WAS94462.1 hypothetical protein O0S08_50745 [Nannocystis poenicansa]